jgi:hypothetical protein
MGVSEIVFVNEFYPEIPVIAKWAGERGCCINTAVPISQVRGVGMRILLRREVKLKFGS